MATLSSILVKKIPWKEEPVRLQSKRIARSWTQLNEHALRIMGTKAGGISMCMETWKEGTKRAQEK